MRIASMKYLEAPQSTRATVSAVLWFAPVREIGIWIDFDSLLATHTGTIKRGEDIYRC